MNLDMLKYLKEIDRVFDTQEQQKPESANDQSPKWSATLNFGYTAEDTLEFVHVEEVCTD